MAGIKNRYNVKVKKGEEKEEEREFLDLNK
jgi:hypothetical protein